MTDDTWHYFYDSVIPIAMQLLETYRSFDNGKQWPSSDESDSRYATGTFSFYLLHSVPANLVLPPPFLRIVVGRPPSHTVRSSVDGRVHLSGLTEQLETGRFGRGSTRGGLLDPSTRTRVGDDSRMRRLTSAASRSTAVARV
jgi:hypothetical protein